MVGLSWDGGVEVGWGRGGLRWDRGGAGWGDGRG